MYLNLKLTEPRRATSGQLPEVMGKSHDSITRLLLSEEL
jgi:hypothetical protein